MNIILALCSAVQAIAAIWDIASRAKQKWKGVKNGAEQVQQKDDHLVREVERTVAPPFD